ncbi:MAG: cadherin-like beta sandwich domain-containing protein [Bacilli bacterium]|nr:cadherin-like beta sandwich domain-containing protein [Bacilli bacterium]
MKRIKYLVFTVLVSIMGIASVYAASLSMSATSKSITVGGTTKVTVTANGAAGWEYCLSYDSSVLQLTSGNKCIMGSTLAGNQKVTFTFKALKQGSTTISLGDVSMLDDEANELSVTKGSVTVTVRSQSDISANENTGSDNAYLRALEVVGYDLNPAFDKKTYSYDVEVPNDVTEVGINAFKEDGTAVISTNVEDIDHIALSEGVNKVVITVRAQKGNKLEYVVNIKRDETDPIVVKIDDKEYTVLRSLDDIEKPKYYTEDTIEIEEQNVPTLTSEVTGYTLVALKDSEGNVGLFSYSNGKYEKYVEVSNQMVTLIPKNIKTTLDDYKESKEIDINGNKVTVYYNESNDDFVMLYAMNVSNGETAWYVYDIKEGTLQRYNEQTKVEEKKGKDIYFYLAIGFAIVSGLAILIIFMIMGMNNRLRKKNEKLVSRLKEKKVKIVEHPVFESDIQVDSWKDIKADDYDDSDLSDEEFFAREEDEMARINDEVEIKADAFATEEIVAPVPKKTRAEKKRDKKKAKVDKEKEEAELKAMRDDFLKTRELEITKEMRTAGEDKKSKKKSKKKKK